MEWFVLLSLFGVVVLFLAAGYLVERWKLRRFWDRPCTGRLWRRAFPDASKDTVREFLATFIAAFGFSDRRRLKFSPADPIMTVYQAVNPTVFGMGVDALEIETFCLLLVKDRYGVDLTRAWHEGITLGEVFTLIRPAPPPSGMST